MSTYELRLKTRQNLLITMYLDGDIPLEIAANRLGITEDEFLMLAARCDVYKGEAG